MNMTKEERNAEREERRAEREEYRKSRELERAQVEQQIAENHRREDIIAERDLWAGTVQIALENSKSLTASITIADDLLEAYRARFQ